MKIGLVGVLPLPVERVSSAFLPPDPPTTPHNSYSGKGGSSDGSKSPRALKFRSVLHPVEPTTLASHIELPNTETSYRGSANVFGRSRCKTGGKITCKAREQQQDEERVSYLPLIRLHQRAPLEPLRVQVPNHSSRTRLVLHLPTPTTFLFLSLE